MSALFGPAGNSESFTLKKYKSSADIPKYLKEFSLDAYEYQCGRGVRVSKESASSLKKAAEEENIILSLHAPYFISLSSVEEEKRVKSVDYILQSAVAANDMGAKRIIVHSGSCAKLARETALEYAKETLRLARAELIKNNFQNIHICPETMGKINQLGTLEETLELCSVDDSFIPCIDFGHLNARTMGGIKCQDDFLNILKAVENKLGKDRLKVFHSHFSKIEYTKGGEKKHLTFADEVYGPEFEPLSELIYRMDLSPTFICESDGTQAEDASVMKEIYLKFFN